MRVGLTPRQLDLLEYLREYIGREGHAPTYDQMSLDLKTSRAFAHKLVCGLIERGYVQRLQNRPRALALVDEPERFAPVVEKQIAAYCKRNKVDRVAAVSRAVEAFFGRAA
ncbi:LexA family protein [Bosea sp. RCC_152_1]|uniref:LexA family protein n=1 Tax=Bosea sp. RCC_152_1 TaxID=3239228 RepID=UPI003523E2E7